MDEILTRLAAIEERLTSLEYREERSHEGWEQANERRRDDIAEVRSSVRELESTLRYEIDQVRNEARRSNSRW